MKTLATVLALAGLVLAVAGTAEAVSYTVDGLGPLHFPGPVTPPSGSPWGPTGYPGDTVELVGYTGTLDLTPGTSIHKINTLRWTVDYTYAGTDTQWDYPDHWSQLSFDIDAARGMSVGTAAGSLSQTGLLEVNWDNDYLSYLQGPVTSFIVNWNRVDVTPLGVARKGAGGSGPTSPWIQPERDVMARFDVTPIPEPVTMAGLVLGIGCLAGYIRRRRLA